MSSLTVSRVEERSEIDANIETTKAVVKNYRSHLWKLDSSIMKCISKDKPATLTCRGSENNIKSISTMKENTNDSPSTTNSLTG